MNRLLFLLAAVREEAADVVWYFVDISQGLGEEDGGADDGQAQGCRDPDSHAAYQNHKRRKVKKKVLM